MLCRFAGACKSWASNVGICCVEMSPSFGLGFKLQHFTYDNRPLNIGEDQFSEQGETAKNIRE